MESAKIDPGTLLSNGEPWYAKHAGKALIAAFLLLLLSVLGLIPSQMSQGIEALKRDHQFQAQIQLVQCVHEADYYTEPVVRARKQKECVEGRLAGESSE